MKTVVFLGVLFVSISCAGQVAETKTVDAQPTSVAADEFKALREKCGVEAANAPTNTDPQLFSDARNCMQRNQAISETAREIDNLLKDLSPEQRERILTFCNVHPSAADDIYALKTGRDCVAGQASKLRALSDARNALMTYLDNLGRNVDGASSPSKQPGAAAGAHIGSSAYSTPSTCVLDETQLGNGVALNNTDLIGVRRELLAPKEASDIYGHRLGKNYIVYQVRVSDYSKDYQYVVHDITVNLKEVMRAQEIYFTNSDGTPLPPTSYLASSRDLNLLRGVPEKGQDLDPRNLTLHVLTGIGSVAGGVSGLTPFSDVMGSAVSVFNGAFLQAFVGIAPDHTGTQLNRLSDEAFTSNTLIDKLHTKVFAIFIPQALVLKTKYRKDHWGGLYRENNFWDNPREVLDTVPLDQVDVCVDGSLVTEVSITPAPAFSPAGPNVAPGQKVAIQDSAADATIYFTTVDGTTPTATSDNKYSSPIAMPTALGTTKTIQAIAVSPNKQQSSIVSQSYIVQKMPLISVTAAAAAGGPATLTITAADSAKDTIYYTLDGSTPVAPADGANPTGQTKKYATTPATTFIPDPSGTTVIEALEVPTGTGSTATTPVTTYIYKGK